MESRSTDPFTAKASLINISSEKISQKGSKAIPIRAHPMKSSRSTRSCLPETENSLVLNDSEQPVSCSQILSWPELQCIELSPKKFQLGSGNKDNEGNTIRNTAECSLVKYCTPRLVEHDDNAKRIGESNKRLAITEIADNPSGKNFKNKKKIKTEALAGKTDNDVWRADAKRKLCVCSKCGKTFPCRRASGGHKSSLISCTRPVEESESSPTEAHFPTLLEEYERWEDVAMTPHEVSPIRYHSSSAKTYSCGQCSRVFSSGRALGGHRSKCHRVGKKDIIQTLPEQQQPELTGQSSGHLVKNCTGHRVMHLDLNLPPPPEEEDLEFAV